jgi:hypothetical protein
MSADPDCPACAGTGRIGPYFPGGISSDCGNCWVARPIAPAILALLQEIDRRDPPHLGVYVEASATRTKALNLGLIVKIRRMKVGHNWLFGLSATGRAAVEREKS